MMGGRASVPDKLIFVHNKLKDAGLDGEESLLQWSNTAHRMMAEITSSAQAANMPTPTCVEIWTMYLTLRQQGYSSLESRQSVGALAGGIFNAVK